MSARRKTGDSKLTKGQRLDSMARKREERAVRAAHRKEKKMAEHMADDENFVSFAAQLGKMGLQLRDIQGDGNCLFRALGDQYEGHGRNHYKNRLEVCQYIQDHREDFEPFVEDDVPFDRHISNLKKMGTYAGNDAIVAFARLHNVNVVIHQFNSPSLYISGGNNPSDRALHISYHNGDHYCSVRKMGDNTETPACIKASEPEKPGSHGSVCNGHQRYSPEPDYSFESFNGNGYDSDYDNLSQSHLSYQHSQHQPYNPPPASRTNREYVARAIRGKEDVEDYVMKVTNCMDRDLVQQTLENHFYDVDSSVDFIISLVAASNKANNHYGHDDQSLHSNHSDSGIWSENGTATRLFGQSEQTYATVDKSKGAKPKQRPLSAKEMKKQKKLEKKQKSMDRHRTRLLGGAAQNSDANGGDFTDEETIISNMGMVKI